MTDEQIQALKARYAVPETPKCSICGEVMSIQSAGGGRIVYGCAGRIDVEGDVGYKFAEGRDFADMHYANSRVTVWAGDQDVMDLLAECEADKALIAEQDRKLKNVRDGLNNWATRNAENEGAVGRLFMANQRIAELEARTVTPLNFSESADADFCREWAWGEIKNDLPTEHWKAGDNGTFYGFYLMGWHARLQYNEQRRAENLQIAKAVGLVRTLTVKFDRIPVADLGDKNEGKKHPYLFGAGYNSAVVDCESHLVNACAAAGIPLVVGGEDGTN